MNASSHVQAAEKAAAKVAAEKEAAEHAAAEEAATRMESQAAADNFQKQLKQAAQVRHPCRYSYVATEIAFFGPFLQFRACALALKLLNAAEAPQKATVTSSSECACACAVQENTKLSAGLAPHPFLMRRTAQPKGGAPKVRNVVELTSPPLPPLHVTQVGS